MDSNPFGKLCKQMRILKFSRSLLSLIVDRPTHTGATALRFWLVRCWWLPKRGDWRCSLIIDCNDLWESNQLDWIESIYWHFFFDFICSIAFVFLHWLDLVETPLWSSQAQTNPKWLSCWTIESQTDGKHREAIGEHTAICTTKFVVSKDSVPKVLESYYQREQALCRVNHLASENHYRTQITFWVS